MKYRYLNQGEMLKEGDELSFGGEWLTLAKAGQPIRKVSAAEASEGVFRRPKQKKQSYHETTSNP